jgi:hypothetical protein
MRRRHRRAIIKSLLRKFILGHEYFIVYNGLCLVIYLLHRVVIKRVIYAPAKDGALAYFLCVASPPPSSHSLLFAWVLNTHAGGNSPRVNEVAGDQFNLLSLCARFHLHYIKLNFPRGNNTDAAEQWRLATQRGCKNERGGRYKKDAAEDTGEKRIF